MDVLKDLSKANFRIKNVANNTINSNYDLAKEHEENVININKAHEQKTYHAENIEILDTYNDKILISMLDNFQHKFSDRNLMQRLLTLRSIESSPSSLPNFTICGLIYTDIAQFATRIEDFFESCLKNSYIKAYISKMYGDDIKISILSIISTDNLLKGIVGCLLLEYKVPACGCVIVSDLSTYAQHIQYCSSGHCSIKWMNSSIGAVKALRKLTNNSNKDWPNWKTLIHRFMASDHYCPSDTIWNKPTQSNTITDIAQSDIAINEARLRLLTIAHADKDLPNAS